MLWYPYAQMKTMAPPIHVSFAHGCILETKRGPLIDSVSSWWSTIYGYNHPALREAMERQLSILPHVMLGGLSHKPAEKLAKRLEEWLPGDLNHVFFSDSGSVAVEVALKMALQYSINQNKRREREGKGEEPLRTDQLRLEGAHHENRFDLPTPRLEVLSLTHSYHGDTFKTMEIGDDEDYHFILSAYGKSPYVHHIPTTIDALEEAFAAYGHRLYAMIVEPLLQGAGGMLMYDISFLERARELCDEYGVLLIFDEVATGFGRTGHRFVADVVLPDILCLGKALTGGTMGHAATIARDHVFDAFYDDDPDFALMHGPTFMGNPMACAVALAGIDLFEELDIPARVAHIEEKAREIMEGFSAPGVKEVRIMGGCIAVEVEDRGLLEGYQEFAISRGVFARPFLNIAYAMVPYIISDEELTTVLTTMKDFFTRPRS